MDRDQQIARNLAVAEKFFDGYHHSVERGALTLAFDPVDFADEWVFCSPFLGGEQVHPRDSFLAEGAVANHATISARIPDYKMDDLRAWPTERGCAWRWRVNGHDLDGRHREFWECLFTWSDDAGKVTRFEFYDDWFGFPQTLAYAYDQPIDDVTHIASYGHAPFTPGPTMAIHPPAAPPYDDPPATASVAHHVDLAQRWFGGYHESVTRGRVEGVFDPRDFAPRWTLFSPWLGERELDADTGYDAFSAVEQQRIWTRLPDYRMDDLAVWPTDDGCAWRWRVHGHTDDGTEYEFWEQVFVLTDADGLIVRFEFFDDWQGFPQTLGYVTGLSVDELWDPANYQRWATGT